LGAGWSAANSVAAAIMATAIAVVIAVLVFTYLSLSVGASPRATVRRLPGLHLQFTPRAGARS
jgi:hypothetical protein